MGRVKTINTSVFITFAVILIFLGVVVYNYDFEAGLDRGAEIEGLDEYIHTSDKTVVDIMPNEITSVHAYLTREEVQIRFEYGQFFHGVLRSNCSEPGEWADEAAVPSEEINLNEQEAADFLMAYAEIKPEYYLDDNINLGEPGLDKPEGCVVIRTDTAEFLFWIGNEHQQSGYRYLKVDGESRIYLVSNRVYTHLENFINI